MILNVMENVRHSSNIKNVIRSAFIILTRNYSNSSA